VLFTVRYTKKYVCVETREISENKHEILFRNLSVIIESTAFDSNMLCSCI